MSARCRDTSKTEMNQQAPRPQPAVTDARLAAVVEAAYILEARSR